MSDTVRTAPPPLIASTSTDVTPQNIVYSEIGEIHKVKFCGRLNHSIN